MPGKPHKATTTVTEISDDIFRISTYVPVMNLQFNQFLVRDEEPLLYLTGMRGLFPEVHRAVATLIDPTSLRWIGFSHFEADECGALTQWQSTAPAATAACSLVGKLVSVDDVVATRPARGMRDSETLDTGKYRFRFLQTPHVPHCWEAGLLFEETTRALFCSDLFYHQGDVEPVTGSDVVGRCERTLRADQQGPFANAYPYGPATRRVLERLAGLQPRLLATMHGSGFNGDGARALQDLDSALHSVLAQGEPVESAASHLRP